MESRLGSDKYWREVFSFSKSYLLVTLKGPHASAAPALSLTVRLRPPLRRIGALLRATPALPFSLRWRSPKNYASALPRATPALYFALCQRFPLRYAGAHLRTAPALFPALRRHSPLCFAGALLCAPPAPHTPLMGHGAGWKKKKIPRPAVRCGDFSRGPACPGAITSWAG